MEAKSIGYWNKKARSSPAEARDAVLVGFTTEKRFDDSGLEDAQALLWPFINKGDTVLEVGCGLGRLLKWSAARCRHAIGLDVSRGMLEGARHRLAGVSNVTLRQLPLSLKFPVRSKSVGFCYFYHVSEHMEREDAFTILKAIRRILKESGTALVQFSLIDHVENQREFRKWAVEGDDEGVRSRFYSESEVHALLSMARLFPQYRIFIPGEVVLVVRKTDDRVLGETPGVRLPFAY